MVDWIMFRGYSFLIILFFPLLIAGHMPVWRSLKTYNFREDELGKKEGINREKHLNWHIRLAYEGGGKTNLGFDKRLRFKKLTKLNFQSQKEQKSYENHLKYEESL